VSGYGGRIVADRREDGMKVRLCVLAFIAVFVAVYTPGSSAAHQPDIPAGGAFTCDFGLSPDAPFDQIAPLLERDRMYMAARPGFMLKFVPLRIDPLTNEVTSGGRYLFKTKEDADAYRTWVMNDFTLDGVKFFDRPYFLSPDCRAWSVIGAHEFSDTSTQVLVRTERWRVPASNQRQLLSDRWPALRSAAADRGFSVVELLYNKQDQMVSVIAIANRIVPPDPYVPDFTSLLTLEYSPPLGQLFDDQPWIRIFDRTHWVLTTWFPFTLGDVGSPSLWPNSPPFPQPYAGDGVCEVSRGENSLTAPADCLATCGDGIAQEGETTMNCPGDVRI
jgi:hypothetical protein